MPTPSPEELIVMYACELDTATQAIDQLAPSSSLEAPGARYYKALKARDKALRSLLAAVGRLHARRLDEEAGPRD